MEQTFFKFDEKILNASERALERAEHSFARIEKNTEYNQQKVLAAFIENRVSESHFTETTGYGYGDRGRETLDKVFASAFGAEAALVRHSFACGTHTLGVALFGLLRPGDTMLSVTGQPYDTIHPVIGITGEGMGSLKDFGVKYEQVDLNADGEPDIPAITEAVKAKRPKLVYIQRSRGYTLRPSLSVEKIAEIAKAVKSVSDSIVFVDNCYGEFVQRVEPVQVGADIMAGSLIKNAGGGIAKNGGYIAGKADLVEKCAYRATVPGLGREVGASLGQNRELFMGIFNSPHIVGEALKTAVFAAALFEEFGFDVTPTSDEERFDIIQTVQLRTPEALIAFCQGMQRVRRSIRLSCPSRGICPAMTARSLWRWCVHHGLVDRALCGAPLREPYAAWMQAASIFTVPSGRHARGAGNARQGTYLMSDFKGITQDALFLMQLNRFNDSKAFYDENKEKIKANMTVPMRQIAASLSDMMLDIDPFMNTIPTKMVSRVRRDTRYAHDKHLYRENMWIMFMRPKKEWHMYPCMWFEVTPQAWSCGVGTYEVSADYMEVFREHLRNDPEASKRL